ncbi:transcription factor RcaD [Planktothrix sp. FACHB-1355]|uniref:Transcription factor RcaD n=1 Tax=Aerosakkonema funiforme FACHB-1375 TaxID=2949571 RepID=A0A926VLB8_9CYAN|nr:MULTISPECIES: transcription factor RcaD [Oscillatoriales]MBD2185865.1 transcription factor RcaD [Aerosakkonema funiforme FACHB-1375]MBD3561955.1 transcription factor RcaD [Planktothrix sp. FACHB-1355]
METNELKFLLKLLGCPNYRSSLSATIFKEFKGKDKICRELGEERELIDFSREMATVKILPPGRALLKIDVSQLPIADKELKLLEKIGKASGKIKPSDITVVKAAEREEILKNLADRGLIEAENKLKRQKAEVWLTPRGLEYLRDDYNPKGSATISLDLLKNYLNFLRKSLREKSEVVSPPVTPTAKPSDDEILQIIRDLDKELGTENYLPIFHLRQKLQPPLSREELDRSLYRLQRDDRIELSSLVDTTPYTPEQIDAGIPQDIGGPLFFIVAN